MIRMFFAVMCAAVFFLPADAEASADPCLGCHEEKTPGIVRYWKESVHYREEVGCASCHGTDVDANHDRSIRVDGMKCGSCHEEENAEHKLSKHAISLRAGRGCTRNMPESAERDRSCDFCHKPGSAEPFVSSECAMFLAQSPEMQRQGCGTCHRVETDCDSCHTRHGTDTVLAGRAETCGICHMGPDHAQYEMWRSSAHGVIYRESGEEDAPTCVTCHMDGGTHNVSRGIATGRPENVRVQEREFMVSVCSRCHTRALAKRNLDDADKIEGQSRAVLGEAKEIIQELHTEGLVEPSPSERPEHPLFGHELIIGPHMLYENLSSVETLFFRMMMFYYMSSYKGVFHQNPDYAHWFGNAPLKLALSELKSEAAVLRKIDVIRKRLDNLSANAGTDMNEEEEERGELIRRLRELKDLRLRGKMSEEEYIKKKNKILDEWDL
jgi:hypothetical protein